MNARPTRKKIALCLEYPLALRGGVSVLVETLILGLKDQYELVLVSPDTPESLAGSTAAKCISKHLVWNPATVSRATSRQLARQIADEGVHLAHFHLGGVFGWGNRLMGQCPIPWLDRAGVPVFSTVHLVVHLLEGYCGPQKPFWFKLALFPFAWASKLNELSHVRREIAVSQHDARKLGSWYWPRRSKFLQIYHSRLRAADRGQENAAREKVVLNVGHIAWRKGQTVLTEAFAQVAPRYPDWKLSLVGKVQEQAEEVQIRAIARAHGLEDRIQLVGERQDAVNLMRRAAIYVQPSYHEALGLALQEAQFAGCASIGTNVGGIPELIQHQSTGLLVEPGNAREMAQALETLMSNAELRERYGRQAAASMVQKGMTEEQMIRNHVQLYESILQEKTGGNDGVSNRL